MYEDVGFLQPLSDPIRSLIEVHRNVKPIMILSRDVKVVRYVGFRMVQYNAFSRGQDSFDGKF
jgi:hypothetical protein